MATKYECDRCKEQFNGKLHKIEIKDSINPSIFDLCTKCVRELRQWLLKGTK